MTELRRRGQDPARRAPSLLLIVVLIVVAVVLVAILIGFLARPAH